MRLPYPEKTATVLIGTSRYEADDLGDLPSVRNNLDDVLAVFTDPELGGLDRARCAVITDPADVTAVYRTLRVQAQAAEDTLLVYYAGHGLVGDNSELYLGLHGTNLDELPVTAFEYDLLADVVRNSTARNRVVILDCCFSGLAAPDAMGDVENALSGLLAIEGTFVLTSSAANHVSTAPPGERNTTFTGELLHLLTAGVPDGPGLLTLTTIFTQLLASAKARGYPLPRRRGTGTADLLALARNPAVHRSGHGSGTGSELSRRHPSRSVAQRTVSGRQAVGVLAAVAILAAGVPLTVHWLGTDNATSAEPLKVLSITDFHSTRQDAFFALPDPVTMSNTEAKSFTDAVSRQSDRFRSWYVDHGGAPAIDAGFTNVTVRSDTGGTVRITDMAVDKRCQDPFDGTVMLGYTQGGGEDSVAVAFNLDSPSPIPEAMGNTTTGLVGTGTNYFASKTVLVDPDGSLTLSLGAYTKHQSCTFTFRMMVATDDGTVEQRIDDDGKPFVVTAKAAPTSRDRPLSGYEAAYVQDESLVWQQKDPTNYSQE